MGHRDGLLRACNRWHHLPRGHRKDSFAGLLSPLGLERAGLGLHPWGKAAVGPLIPLNTSPAPALSLTRSLVPPCQTSLVWPITQMPLTTVGPTQSAEHPCGELQEQVTSNSGLRPSWLCRDEGQHLHLPAPARVQGTNRKSPRYVGSGAFLEEGHHWEGPGKSTGSE